MVSIAAQRDIVLKLKRETQLNVGRLNKLKPLPTDLSRSILKEDGFEKPTQNIFNNLSYYLVSIIDPQRASGLSWPLYDTKTERVYRNEISSFISEYSSKGLLSPVMSSYLVNPGSYKVTVLLFQLSQLAIQQTLKLEMQKESQKQLYDNMTEKYRHCSKEKFIEGIETETQVMLVKFSNYMRKRKVIERIAEIMRSRIVKMEDKLKSCNIQNYLNKLVDNFIKQNNLSEDTKTEVLKIKDINKSSVILDKWLIELDKSLDEMEIEWDNKTSLLFETCRETKQNTEAVIARHTSEANRNLYVMEYNHKTDEISTNDLQAQVNSQQKFVLKNIVKDDKLIFPNLVRSFVISICFILKNIQIGDDIFKFNEYLECGRNNFKEMVTVLRLLITRVMNAESKLQPSAPALNQSVSINEICKLPPLPDLSDLKTCNPLYQTLFESPTPLSFSKHQFNLRKRNLALMNPSKPLLITPFNTGMHEDFLKSFSSCRISNTQANLNQTRLNASIIPHSNNRGNETIAECSTGFTQSQINRLFTTKKSSSSKKFKYKLERPNVNVKKTKLFDECNLSNESKVLYRSHSSPNLFENRLKRPLSVGRGRKLSIMQEGSPSLLEVSGIGVLGKSSRDASPRDIFHDSNRTLRGTQSLKEIEVDLNREIEDLSVDSQTEDQVSIGPEMTTFKPSLPSLSSVSPLDAGISQQRILQSRPETPKMETPKNIVQMSRRSNSIEKIIQRFKKVACPKAKDERSSDFQKIIEDKELDIPKVDVKEFSFHKIAEEKENNFTSVNMDVSLKSTFPDLLCPTMDYLDQWRDDVFEKNHRKPRESLGTALGVDNTFLDQFDLVD